MVKKEINQTPAGTEIWIRSPLFELGGKRDNHALRERNGMQSYAQQQ